MASRSFKKYANLGLDEEKDFFLASLNKRIRNARKKIEQIDELAKKDKSTLKSEQLEKIKSRPEVLENIKYVDEIKDMYYSAYKTAKEEGKPVSSAADNIPAGQGENQAEPSETQSQSHAQPQVQSQTQEVSHADALGKVLNLVHFAQFFRDQGHVQEFRQANVESVADFESFYEFYVKVFTFSESDKLVRVEDKLNRSLSELESYVNAAQQPALRNQTYGHLQKVVERVCDSTWFKEHKADVSTRQAKTGAEPSAIGSELKKTHEEAPAPVHHQEKHKSPEKEATKVSPVKEAKRDWGTVEDEEEEEEGLDKLREEERQENKFEGEGGRAVDESEKHYTTLRDKQHEEEAKQKTVVVDEWATVTAKHKEKKEEKPFRGGNKPFRGGDGQRGDRGGQRRPRPEGEGEKRERKPRVEGEGEGQGQEGENRGQRGGFRGGNRGGARGGFQKRDGDEYRRKEGGDVYQKKNEGANKTTEGQ